MMLNDTLTECKIWIVGETSWRLEVIGLKTDVNKFASTNDFTVCGEVFGENNKPHKFLLTASFKDLSTAKKWAKRNSFLYIKD